MLVINTRFLTQKITGTQRFAIEVAKCLKKMYAEVIFISPKNIIHYDLAKELDVKRIGINTGHIWEQVDLPLYLKKLRTPILLNLVNTAPLFYNKNIVTIHDLAFLRYPQWFSSSFAFFYRFLIPKIAKSSIKILTVSNFSKSEIVEILKIPPDRVEVVYNGVDEKFFFYRKLENERYEGRKNYILSVSSLNPRKNLKNLLLAFKKLNLKEYKLVLVGSSDRIFADVNVKDLLKGIRNVEFKGYINDEQLRKLYSEALVFVYPSLYEGFGLPPLEAMAAGTPVVVSQIPSIEEVCKDAAIYINPYDVNSIAEGILEAINNVNLRVEKISKGYIRANKFSWDRVAKKIFEVVKDEI